MRISPFVILLAGFMVLLDVYVFQALKYVSYSVAPKLRSAIFIIYWTLSLSALVLFFLLPYIKLDKLQPGLRNLVFVIIIGWFFAKFVTAIFLLVDDLRRGVQWLAGKLFFLKTEGEQLQEGETISRSLFLSWAGLGAGTGLFGSLLYGFSNKYDYHVKNVALNFPNLPPSFRGLRIVQLSDIHSGSFTDTAAVRRGIDKALALKPDLILFTGDLVNNIADEMQPYMEVFSRLKAPMGVYSILGNHDYGDYVEWGSTAEKAQNLERLKKVHATLGWKLMMNEHTLLQRGGEQIALLGIENWSAKKRFPKYGILKNAYAGTENMPFKILMSHDPSHWEAEVLTKYQDIDLMLSGHTHGMQFGVELPWFKWSPVQYVYKQWAGLYEQDGQKLYVNRGYGFIGYPGRVGILPEITLIELT